MTESLCRWSRMLAAIDEETLLVPFSHVLFKSAFLQDARAITERAHEVGAMVVLDTYQSAGTVPFSVRDLNVDFATGGSVKWLCGGPGAGYLYVRPDLQQKLEPKTTRLDGPRIAFRVRYRTSLCAQHRALSARLAGDSRFVRRPVWLSRSSIRSALKRFARRAPGKLRSLIELAEEARLPGYQPQRSFTTRRHNYHWPRAGRGDHERVDSPRVHCRLSSRCRACACRHTFIPKMKSWNWWSAR